METPQKEEEKYVFMTCEGFNRTCGKCLQATIGNLFTDWQGKVHACNTTFNLFLFASLKFDCGYLAVTSERNIINYIVREDLPKYSDNSMPFSIL